eukprot:scaffold503384_cov48-Prasinocladus_malaysianus.AAC.1
MLCAQVSQPHEARGVISDPSIVQGFLNAARLSEKSMGFLRKSEDRAESDGTLPGTDDVGGVPVLVSGAGHDALAMADLTK